MANSSTPGPSKSLLLKSWEELYVNGEYESYINKLLSSKQLFGQGAFHYNLGTAYLKVGKPAAARYHLEKALSAGSLDPGIYKNLNTAIEQLGVRSIEQSTYLADNALNQALGLPHEFSLSLALVLAVLWIVLLRLRKIGKRFFAVAMALSLCPWLVSSLIRTHYQRAIVLQQGFSYEGPSRSFEASSDIPAGASIIIRKRDDNWLYIKAPTHFSGWIDRDKIGIL